jgi:hypothetical protein
MYRNAKMIPVETVPAFRGRGDEGEQWKGWMQVLYYWCIVRTFVNATMYPYPAQQRKKYTKWYLFVLSLFIGCYSRYFNILSNIAN